MTRLAVFAAVTALTLTIGAAGCGGSGDQDACKRMLGCVAEIEPNQLETLLKTYGTGGSCWTSSSEVAAGCGEFCRKSLRGLALDNTEMKVDDDDGTITYRPIHDSCTECTTDSQCTDEDLPGCHPTALLCVRCTQDAHCQEAPKPPVDETTKTSLEDLFNETLGGGSSNTDKSNEIVEGEGSVDVEVKLPKAYCNVDLAACVECRSDAHCTDSRYPRCHKATGRCGACAESSDCPKETPVCVMVGGDAYGYSDPSPTDYGDYEPSPGSADPYPSDETTTTVVHDRSYCAECQTASDCPTDRPFCDAQRCVECMTWDDCGGESSCVDGTCQRSCADVMSCMRNECAYGCSDPNPLCDLLKCKTAVDFAQCIASNCVGCYRDGFYAYSTDFDCDSCISLNCSHYDLLCTSDGC